jgi:hypothetical protein
MKLKLSIPTLFAGIISLPNYVIGGLGRRGIRSTPVDIEAVEVPGLTTIVIELTDGLTEQEVYKAQDCVDAMNDTLTKNSRDSFSEDLRRWTDSERAGKKAAIINRVGRKPQRCH